MNELQKAIKVSLEQHQKEIIELTVNAINSLNKLQNRIGEFKEIQSTLDFLYENHVMMINHKNKKS